MRSAVDTLMLKPASPRRSPAPAHTASATSRAGAASLPRCAASPAFRSCGPATPSTAPPGSRGPPRRAGHLVQQPGCIARPRRHSLHEGPDQHRSTGRTGSCRCPTTMAGPLHTGTTERLRHGVTVRPCRYGEPTTGRSAREPAARRKSADELKRGRARKRAEARRAAKNALAPQAELVSLHGFPRTPTARLAGPAACPYRLRRTVTHGDSRAAPDRGLFTASRRHASRMSRPRGSPNQPSRSE